MDIPRDAADSERRPLSGFEGHYEITRAGYVWSIRLKRFIKWTYDPLSARQWIQFSVAGEKHKIGVWRAVIESWLSIDDLAALRGAIPTDAHGRVDVLKAYRAEIDTLGRRYALRSDFLFAFFLAN